MKLPKTYQKREMRISISAKMGVRLKKKKARKTRTIFQIGEKKGRICFIIEVLSVNCLMVEK